MGLTAQEIANIAFTGAIQATGAALSDAEGHKAKVLWAEIRQKFQGQEAVEDILNDVESQESREILEQQIVLILQRAMDKDDRFAQKLQNISTGDITGENANVVNSSGDRFGLNAFYILSCNQITITGSLLDLIFNKYKWERSQ